MSNHMWYWSSGWFLGMHLFWWLFWVAVLVLAVGYWGAPARRGPVAPAPETPMAILRRRYVEGAISTEEYLERGGRLEDAAPATR